MQIINENDVPTVVIGGEHHEIEKMNEASKYYVDQIHDLNMQLRQIKGKAHQFEIARSGFINLLKEEIAMQNELMKGGEDMPTEEAPEGDEGQE